MGAMEVPVDVVRFRILGPLEFERSGSIVDVGTFRQKSLLALLLIHPNQILATDRILDDLWGDDASGRQNSLWVHISHLRSALEPERSPRSEGTILLTRPPGYMLTVDPSSLDAVVFERMVSEGRGLLSHDPSAAALVFAEALSLWRGRALEEFTYESFAQDEIRRLDSLRLDAVEGRVEADLARGLGSQLVGELEGLIREHPLRERLTAQLMVALYRSGRRAEAVRAYDALQARLTELGVDTSHDIQDLVAQVLEGDPRLQPLQPSVGRSSEPGLAVRGYELRSQIAKHEYGAVYRAYQPAIGREVAVKVIRPELANDPGFIRRFESDTHAISALGSPSVVPLYDFWREPDGAFLVEKLLEGGDLRDLVAAGPLLPPRAVAIVERLGQALEGTHALGVAHGAIRLETVELDVEGNPYLADFGLTSGPATISSDVAGLATCAAQLLAGRFGTVEELAPQLDPPLADVLLQASRNESVGDLVGALRLAAGLARPDEIAPAMINPYKGLEPFDETDLNDFFGRERLVARMIARLGGPGSNGSFLAVIGPSGSGKSSAVRAGLIPAIRAGAVQGSENWFVATMTPGAHPFASLERALVGVAVTVPPTLRERLQQGPAGLRRSVEQILPDDTSPLLLVIDQFEEMYTLVGEEERRTFLEGMTEAITSERSRLRVIITLRADFYDHPLGNPVLGELLRDHTELVTPMTSSELQLAISRPAESVGVTVEPGLLAALTADSLLEPGALPMLQYTLTELFERRSSLSMTAENYEAIGGLTGSVVGRAESLFQALAPPAQAAARSVFLRLVSINEMGDDTRRRVLLSELEGLGGSDGEIDDMLRSFARHRLLSFDRDPASRAPTVEIAHESLIRAWGRLSSWIDGARDDLRAQRRLSGATVEWVAQGRDQDFLWAGTSLVRYRGWLSDPPVRLTAEEHAFLEAAAEQDQVRERAERDRRMRESKLRRRTRALVGLGTVSLLVIVLGSLAYIQRERAQDLAAELSGRDRARELVAESGFVLEGDPGLAALLAIEAIRVTEPTGEALPEAIDALHWALHEATVEYPADDTDLPVAVRPHSDGPRGVFVLSPADLVGLAQSWTARAFSADECEEYFSGASCPDPTLPVASSLTISGGTDDYTGLTAGELPLAGTKVLLTSAWNGEMVTDVRKDLDALGADLGIEVEYRAHRIDQHLHDVATAEDHGDVISPFFPGHILETLERRPVVDVGAYIGETSLREAFGDYLVDMLSRDGSIYGLPNSLSAKSLVWYNPEAFAEAGYSVPTSWGGLIALSDQMVADGNTPWCLGIFQFQDTGWPATDWLETILLQTEGPDFYDQWTRHQVPFDHPAVVAALEKVGQLAHTPGYTLDRKIEETSLEEAALLMSEEPPQCWMAPTPDFGAWLFGEAPRAAFLFPSVEPEYSVAMEGGVGTMFAVADRPEVRAVMRGLAAPSWGEEMAQMPSGWFLPSHRDFDLSLFTDPYRQFQASILTEANDAGMFRFDASDEMPYDIGSRAFFPAITRYLADPDVPAEEILSEMEAAWTEFEEDVEADPGR